MSALGTPGTAISTEFDNTTSGRKRRASRAATNPIAR